MHPHHTFRMPHICIWTFATLSQTCNPVVIANLCFDAISNLEKTNLGNMCKHQIKALFVRGHSGGVLVQQLGTRARTKMSGIYHLHSNINGQQLLQEPLPKPFQESTLKSWLYPKWWWTLYGIGCIPKGRPCNGRHLCTMKSVWSEWHLELQKINP